MSIGENVASRASAGAAPEGARKGKRATRGMLPFAVRPGLVPDGAAARRAWGVAVVQTVRGSNLWWRKGG